MPRFCLEVNHNGALIRKTVYSGPECPGSKILNNFKELGSPREQFEIPIGNFSMGQKKKIFLAKSICEKAHLYIWDEPLNYVDIISRVQIENMILEYSPTMVLVEHDRRFIGKVATDIVELVK